MSWGTLAKEAAKKGAAGAWKLTKEAAPYVLPTLITLGATEAYRRLRGGPDEQPIIPTEEITDSDRALLKAAREDAAKRRAAAQKARQEAIGPVETDIYKTPLFLEAPEGQPKRKPAGGAMMLLPGRRDMTVDETLLAALLTGGPEGLMP